MADQPPAVLPLDINPPPPQVVAPEAAAAAADGPEGPLGAANPSNSVTPSPPNVPYVLALQPWSYRNRYSTQDVRSVWVKPVSGYQSIERRFGPKARKRIYANLQDYFLEGDQDFFFHDEVDVSDSDDGGGHGGNGANGGASGNVYGAGTGYGNGGGNGNYNDDDEENGDGENEAEDEGLPDSSTADNAPFNDAVAHVSDAEALESAFASLNGGPLHDTAEGETAPNPPVQPNRPGARQSPPSVPRVARARINLTALSQRYNLYFAVYQDELHVFRPQPAPEILRGPLLVLKPPPTAAGRQLGGHMSQTFPHQANHIITGDLGGIEIVLLAYDDGDVVAYYTRHIVSYIENLPKRRRGPQPSKKVPQPFFRETVGMTAWGLAVHSQSRLIAVSSNLAEVNVFAFALQPPRADDPLQHKTQPLVVPSDDFSPTTYAGASALELESLLRLRDRYWRILLPLGPSGHNIPSIDFISDAKGIAEKVIAVDINGCIFIMDIWKVGSRPLKITSPHRSGMDVGWGVMVLPAKMFLPTSRMPAPTDRRMLNRYNYPNIDGAFYFSYLNDPARTKPKHTPMAFDTSELDTESDSDVSMDEAADDAEMYGSGYETDKSSEDDEHSQDGENGEDDENSEDMEDSEEDEDSDVAHMGDSTPYAHARTDSTDSSPFTYDPATMSRHWDVLVKRNHSPSSPENLDLKKDAESPFHLGMIICPSIGLTWPNNNLQALIRTLKNSRYRLDHSQEENLYQFRVPQTKEVNDMARRFFILRTYSHTVELLRTDRAATPFYVQNVMKPPSRLPFTLWDMDRDFHRCSLLHCIPEINLVLVGNMFGRVVLIRPLKNKQAVHSSAPTNAPPYAFRIEWTLPLARDEQQGLRPPCCLLGMAVSPVPEPGSRRFGVVNTRKSGRTRRTRRWRLILHYMDHSIFQYYIEETKPGVDKLHVRAY